jgi:hypothetical protein
MKEALSLSSEEAGLEKFKCVFVHCCQIAGQIHMKVGNRYFKIMTEF